MLNSFKLAIRSIWSNKLRSFLTMLGIIIGVAAVITLVGIVNGQMGSMKDSFSSMGTNRITVNVINLSSRFLDEEDMYDFYYENSDTFEKISPTVQVSGTTKVGNESSTSTGITGVSEDYLDIMGDTLISGRFLQYADMEYRSRVAVIGYYLASSYYDSAERAIGEAISINGESYRIVGVVERKTSASESMEEGGSDDYIYIPYTASLKLTRNGKVSSYTLTVSKDETDNAAIHKTKIEDFLYNVFKSSELYNVTAMSELLDSMNEMMTQMSVMLGGIAGISLLVAGVGVMNIMLVSVSERTREIGIRKALGAKTTTILQQFVIEAALTSSIGGIIGILAGIIGTNIAGRIMGTNADAGIGAMLLSFLVSLVIGLLFGYMPARRAAGLNPIDALRSE